MSVVHANPVASSVLSQPSAAQHNTAQPSDMVDLLGLNTDTPCPSAPPQTSADGGMKAASSNSDLLNDLFAPIATSARQDSTDDLIGDQAGQDLFFGHAPGNNSAASQPPKSKINKEVFELGWGLCLACRVKFSSNQRYP